MQEQVISQVKALQHDLAGLIKPEVTPDFISPYMGIPGLIGFWPMATVQRSTGNVPNYAPTYTGATQQDLVYNGNPQFDYTATGVPFVSLDGTGDYLSVADNTDLDVLATEAQNANPGLTAGCWARVAALPGGNVGLISKDGGGANRSWLLFLQNTGSIFGQMTATGAAPMTNTGASAAITTNQWFFAVLRFVPSTSFSVFLDGVETVNAAGIPASIFNSSAALNVGAIAGASLITGDISNPFFSANALLDAEIKSLFQQDKALYNR